MPLSSRIYLDAGVHGWTILQKAKVGKRPDLTIYLNAGRTIYLLPYHSPVASQVKEPKSEHQFGFNEKVLVQKDGRHYVPREFQPPTWISSSQRHQESHQLSRQSHGKHITGYHGRERKRSRGQKLRTSRSVCQELEPLIASSRSANPRSRSTLLLHYQRKSIQGY